jgi:hypothetical protein
MVLQLQPGKPHPRLHFFFLYHAYKLDTRTHWEITLKASCKRGTVYSKYAESISLKDFTWW